MGLPTSENSRHITRLSEALCSRNAFNRTPRWFGILLAASCPLSHSSLASSALSEGYAAVQDDLLSLRPDVLCRSDSHRLSAVRDAHHARLVGHQSLKVVRRQHRSWHGHPLLDTLFKKRESEPKSCRLHAKQHSKPRPRGRNQGTFDGPTADVPAWFDADRQPVN